MMRQMYFSEEEKLYRTVLFSFSLPPISRRLEATSMRARRCTRLCWTRTSRTPLRLQNAVRK